jgi:hypothetical protein
VANLGYRFVYFVPKTDAQKTDAQKTDAQKTNAPKAIETVSRLDKG